MQFENEFNQIKCENKQCVQNITIGDLNIHNKFGEQH